MRKDICFVCVGQCAGNLGSLLVQKGYDVLFINTAAPDLALLRNAKHVYKIPDERGCNQDPEKAQAVFAQHYTEIMQRVKNFVTKRITYFISSSSGGTSGMTPLMVEAFLEHLHDTEDADWAKFDEDCERGLNPKSPEKRKVGLITVLPSISESIVLNANSYNYMRQVGNLLDCECNKENSNLANIFLIDNENEKDILRLNSEFVELFDEVLKIPEKHKSVKGNVDSADLEEAITAMGITILAKVNKDEFSISSLVSSLRYSNIFAQTENEVGKYWVSSTVGEVDGVALEKELGAPLAHYKTYNEHTNLFVLSGMGIPAERIDLIADRAEERASRSSKRNADAFKRDVNVKVQVPVQAEEGSEQPANRVSDKLAAFRKRRR